MKPTPTPTTVSASEFGRLVNRSRTRVGQLIRSGVLPHHEGRLVIDEAVPAFIGHLDSLAKPSKGRERIEIARADKLELENAITRRDMIPAGEVRRDCTRIFGELKSQLLRVPRQLEMPCGREVADRVEREILSCLETVSNANRAKALIDTEKHDSGK